MFCYIGCKERFEPNLPELEQNFLVVEGFINVGAEQASEIRLSRTTVLSEQQSLVPEFNASVFVEGEDNSSYALFPSGEGIYSSGPLSLDQNSKFRLRITTQEGKEYLSEFVAAKVTPPIDSVSWTMEENGVQIYANTHDPQNNTTYYKWDFEETWQIRSFYYPNYRYVDGVVRYSELSDPDIFNCWKYAKSSQIIIGSSAKLQSDIINLQPLLFIGSPDEKLGVRYSMLLKQYALDKSGYEFMEQMKKNTESLGTIFDPQPSALAGNIRCVSDPKELVIGYINATTVTEKRIFIDERELPYRPYEQHCVTDTVLRDQILGRVPTLLPYDAILDMRGNVVAYKTSSPECVDCRERGGSNEKPAYW
jgi:hypothetical protein